MSRYGSDSEGCSIIFRADEIEIATPEYKKTEDEHDEEEEDQDEIQEIEALIMANIELCGEIFKDLKVHKYFLCIKLKSTDYISKLKKLNQIPEPNDINIDKLKENIERILDLLKFKKKTIIDHSIFELAVLSNCFSQKYFQELKKFTINKSAEILGEKIREFCQKVFNHSKKIEHFTELEQTVEIICQHLVRCLKLVKKQTKIN